MGHRSAASTHASSVRLLPHGHEASANQASGRNALWGRTLGPRSGPALWAWRGTGVWRGQEPDLLRHEPVKSGQARERQCPTSRIDTSIDLLAGIRSGVGTTFRRSMPI